METFRAIRRVLWITMGLNLLATAAKLTVGYWTGSLSLIADGFDSVFDSASNVIGLVGLYLAAQPADKDHPYGHRKAETMTALVIASLLFLTTWELIRSAVERLRNPALIQTQVNVWSFGALLVSIIVHLTVVWYELREGRRLRSDVLVADALHTRADIFVSLCDRWSDRRVPGLSSGRPAPGSGHRPADRQDRGRHYPPEFPHLDGQGGHAG